MTSRSEVHHANHYTIEASYKKGQFFYVEVYNVLLFCEVKINIHVTYNEWILAPLHTSDVSDGALQVFFFAKLGLNFAYLYVNPASMLIS